MGGGHAWGRLRAGTASCTYCAAGRSLPPRPPTFANGICGSTGGFSYLLPTNHCRLLAGLDHPHILSFYEAFVESHHLFLVTELAAGGDLAALLG